MKFRLFAILFFITFSSSAQEEPVKITANHSSISLEDLFNSWNRDYDLKISFSVDHASKLFVNCNFKDKPVEEAIADLTKVVGFSYEVVGNNFLIIPPNSSIEPKRFQFEIRGVVRDAFSKEPLPYALVQLEGVELGTTTDNDGFFMLSDVPNDTMTLKVSYLGFEVQSNRLNELPDLNKLDIQLTSSSYDMEEILVVGERVSDLQVDKSSGQLSLNPRIRRRLPSLGDPDVFRTIQLLPGVSGTNGSSAELSIRGSFPGENLVLLDGYTLYHLDHFFGVFSAINSDYIKDVQVYRNPIDTEYGGRVAGVVDLIGKTGSNTEASGSFGINMLTAKASIELPITKKLSFITYGRRSHTDIIRSNTFQEIYEIVRRNRDNNQNDPEFDPFEESIPDFHFYDVNSKLVYRLTEQTAISASWFKSEDKLKNEVTYDFDDEFEDLEFNFTSSEFEDNNWGNNGFSLNLDHRWKNGSSSNFQITTSEYFNNYFYGYLLEQDGLEIEGASFEQNNRLFDVGINLTHLQLINNSISVQSGISNHTYEIDFLQFFNEELEFEENNQYESVTSVFSQVTGNFTKHNFIMGFRVDHSQEIGNLYFQPRASYGYKILPHLQAKLGFSRNFQFVKQVIYFDPIYGNQNYWLAADDEFLDVTRADQFSIGLNYAPPKWTFDIEFYNKRLDGISEFFQPETFLFEDLDEGTVINGMGNTRGMDLMIQRQFKNYTGWVSYSLMQAQQRFDGVNNDEYYSSLQDKRHEFKWVNTFQVGKYNFALNFIYGSGAFFPFYEISDGELNVEGDIEEIEISRDYELETRLPAFHRLDLTVSRKWKLQLFQGEFGVSVFNLYNRQNIKSRRISYSKIEDYYIGRSSQLDPYIDLELLSFTPSFFLNVQIN